MVGCKTGGIQGRRDVGQVEYRAEKIQNRTDAGNIEYRICGM